VFVLLWEGSGLLWASLPCKKLQRVSKYITDNFRKVSSELEQTKSTKSEEEEEYGKKGQKQQQLDNISHFT